MEKQLLATKTYNNSMRAITTLLLIAIGFLNVQAQSGAGCYSFTAATGTFTSIASTGTQITFANSDDAFSPSAIPIGFSFIYGGASFSSCFPNTNGFLSFNSNAPLATAANSRTTVLNTVDANMYPLIAAYKADLQGSTVNGFYRTTGTAPNRVFTVELTDWGVFVFATPSSFHLQIRLFEGSNLIELAYAQLSGTQQSASGIGLAMTNTDFLGLNNTSVAPVASTATATAAAGRPATGQIYRFTPPGQQAFDSTTAIQQTFGAPQGGTNLPVLAIPVFTASAGCGFGATATVFNFNTNGTTNTANLLNAKLYYTGSSPVFSAASQFGATVNNPNGNFSFTSSQSMSAGVNFFWLTYDITSNAPNGNLLDAEYLNATIRDTVRTPLVTTPAGARPVEAPLNGTYNVGVGGNYATVTAAVNALTALGMSGPVTFRLTDTLYNSALGEAFPINIANVAGSGTPNRRITIKPAFGNVATIRSNNGVTSIFNIDNVKYVTIDGRDTTFATTKSLTLENPTNTTTASVVRYLNDAIGGVLTFTNIRSANTNNTIFTIPVIGAVSILGTNRPIPFGNDSIRISNNFFSRANGLPFGMGVTSDGQSLVAQNNNITIDSNDFNGAVSNSIAITGNNTGNGDNFSIRNNNIFDTAVTNTTNAIVGINFVPGSASNGNIIAYNNIGGNQPLAVAGTNRWVFATTNTGSFQGIISSTGATTGAIVRSNRVANFNILNTTAFVQFIGINVQGGVTLIDSNTVGNVADTNNIRVGYTSTHNGILVSFPAQDITIRANTVANINAFTASTSTFLRGINYGGSNNVALIENNLVKSLSTNSTSAGTTSGSALIGILVSGSSNSQTTRNNIVGGPLASDSLSCYNVSGGRVMGMAFSSGINTVTGNSVSNLISRSTTATAGGASSQVVGINHTVFTNGQLFANNTISNLRSFGVASTGMCGILITSSGGGTINNNTISDLWSASNNISTGTAAAIVGINMASSSILNITNNTIFNADAATSASTSVVGIASSSATQNTITGNIIRNLRSNGTNTTQTLVGINYTGSGLNMVIEDNTVHTLNAYNTSAATPGVQGINTTISGTITGNNSSVSRNRVHSFGADLVQTSAVNYTGIVHTGNAVLANNTVGIGRDSSGVQNSRGGTFRGIQVASSGTSQTRVYHNTVVVDARPRVNANNSFALELTGVNTLPGFTDVRNNILVNTSVNDSVATGNHFVTSVPLTYTSNLVMGYNLYQAGVSANSFVGRRGANNYAIMDSLKANYQVEGTSNVAAINFVNTTGGAGAFDLRLTSPTPAEGGGDASVASLVTVDIDNALRSSNTPVDIGADAGNFTLSADVVPPSIVYTRLTNGPSVNRTFTAVIADRYGVSTTDAPRVYFSKNNGTWFSSPGTLTAGNNTNGTWTFTINGATLGGVSVNDVIAYFVIAKDSLGNNTNAEPNYAGASLTSPSVFPTIPAQYTITDPIATTVTVPGTYPTLTGAGGAFEAINNSLLVGNTTIEITGNVTEPGTVQLNQWNESGAGGYTLTIRPQTSAQVIVSGTLANANGLIRLNNSGRVKILGWAATGTIADTSLIIRASSTSTPALGIINGGGNDSIMGVILESRTTSNGVINLQGSTTLGVTNVLFEGNHIRQDLTSPATALPTTALFATGTAPFFNANIRIIGNQFYNFTTTGINASTANGGNWLINNNHFYYNATATLATSPTYINMQPGGTSNDNVINGNWMGGRAVFAGGSRLITSAAFTPIVLSTGLTTGTTVTNNVIANISAATGFTGISVAGTSAAYNVSGNRIGSVDSTTSVLANGAYRFTGINSTATGNVTFINDSVLTIFSTGATAAAGIVGINVTSGSSNVTNISNNLVRGLFANSAINTSTTTAASVIGICLQSFSLNQTVSNNRVQTLSNISVAGHSMYGILITNGVNTVNNNVVYGMVSRTTSVSNASTITPIQGISMTSSTSGNQVITNNTVDSIYYTGTAGVQMFGIMPGNTFGAGPFVITGNTVKNLNSTTTSVVTNAGAGIVGMFFNNTGAANVNLSGNNISLLHHNNPTAATSVIGLVYASSTALVGNNSFVNGNFIHSFRSASTAATTTFTGILNTNGFTTFTNNMVRLGIDSGANLFISPRQVNGIVQVAGTQNRYYHNTIYLAGSPVSGASNTIGFNAQAQIISGQQNDFRNNIIVNAVNDTMTATGLNFAVVLQDSLRHTFNYNLYHTPGNGGFTGRIIASNNNYRLLEDSIRSWKAVTGLDIASANGDPIFTANANGVADVASLAVDGSNNIERSGDPSLTSVTTDFYGNLRASNSPSDIGAHAGNFNLVSDLFPPVITLTPLANTGNTTAQRSLVNVSITDNAGIPMAGANRPRLYFSKDGVTWLSSVASSITGSANNATASFVLDQLLLAPLAVTDTVRYFVVAQDNASNTISNAPFAVATDVNNITNNPTSPYRYQFLPVIAANSVFQVGNGQTYTTLTGAGGFFEFVNSRTLGGSITAEITSDISEPGTTALNEFAEDGSGGYTLTIRPTSGTSSPWLLSGSTSGAMVVINGADRVKLNGVPTGGANTQKMLRFRNNGTGPVVQIQNGAVGCRVNNVLVEGGSNTTTSGALTIITNAGTVPCSFDTISGCVIGNNPTLTFPNGIAAFGFYAQGSPGVFNHSCVFTNNEVYNYSNSGAVTDLNTGDNWQFTNNSFYNNLPISVTTGQLVGLNLVPNQNGSGFIITGNFMGGTAANAGGTPWLHTGSTQFIGLRYSGGVGANAIIRNNTIQNINFNVPAFSQFTGINVLGGNAIIGGTPAQGNLIGSLTNANSIIYNGFSGGFGISLTGANTMAVSGNTVSGLLIGTPSQSGTFTGISVTNGNLVECTNNTVGSTTLANSINNVGSGQTNGIVLGPPANLVASYTATNNTVSNMIASGNQSSVALRGIVLQNGANPTLTNNTVSNLTTNSGNVSTSFSNALMGIFVSVGSATIPTVNNNTVTALRALGTTGGVNVTGISLNAGQGAIINANRIFDLTNASTSTSLNPTASVAGVQVSGGSTNAFITNNQISLGTGQTTNTQFIGIWTAISNTGLTVHAVNNSVLVTGASSSGNNNTYAFMRGLNTGVEQTTFLNLRNNIFANNRTGGTGNHYAVSNQTTAPTAGTWNNTSSQYNLLVTANSSTVGEWGITANDFATWTANSAGDNWSYYIPSGSGAGLLNLGNLFTNAATGNMGIQTANVESWYVFGKGIAGVASNNLSTDYSGVARGTTLGFGTTLGSVQLNTAPSMLPPAAIASATPTANGTSIYRFASRPVVTLAWGASAPTTATLYNFAGVNPPAALGGNNLNQYARVAVTGGTTPYNYTATVHYDPALIGGVTNTTNLRVANETTGSNATTPVWQLQNVSTVNQANNTVVTAALTSSLSNFYFSGNENTAPPTITSFTPNAREVGGAVTIRGSLFTGATAVSFNGTAQPTYTVVNDTTITTTVPVGATTGTVSITNAYGTRVSTAIFTVIPAPTVTNLSVTTGTIGQAVTITGTGFTWATQVQFNTTNAVFTIVNNTTITTTVPVGATTGLITVTNPAGNASSVASFTVIPAPTIASFTPTSAAAGASVTITGANFVGVTAVTFNNVSASYNVVNATTINAFVPNAATTGAIRVTNGSGTGVSASNFTVIAVPTLDAFAPSSGGIGTVVTITGTNFASIDSVEFGGGVNATFVVNSSTQITATVVTGSFTGPISIYRNGLAAVTSSSNFVVINDLIVNTAQNVSGTYNNITVTSTGTATLTGTLTALGNTIVQSGGAMDFGTFTLEGNGNFTAQTGSSLRIGSPQGISATGGISGNVLSNGTRTYGGKVEYNGIVAQNSGNGLQAGVDTLTVTNVFGVTLTANATVNNRLVLGTGNLLLGNNNLTMAGSVVVGPTGYVVTNGTGSVRRTVSNNATNVLFPVGSTFSYTPAQLQLTNASTTDIFSVRVLNGILSNATSGSAINQSQVNRTWVVNESVTGGSNLTVTLTWDDSLEVNGFTRSNCAIATYTTSWARTGTLGAATGTNPYSRTLSNVTSFNAFAIGDVNATLLPVRLINFEAKANGNDVVLNWATASEKNNSHFVVERSTDGVNFNEVTTVSGKGTTNAITKYKALDKDAFGINTDLYYRLKQVDLNGSFAYSGVVLVSNDAKVEFNVNVQPNPFAQQVALTLVNAYEGEMLIEVVDAVGKLVFKGTKTVKAGSQTIDLTELNTLNDGAYFLNATLNGQVTRVKLIKAN